MGIKFKIKKTGNQFDKLVKGIRDLDGESVEIGHFQSQGEHPESDLTYAELMAVHHNPAGSGLSWPARPVLDILFAKNINLNDPEIMSAIRKYNNMTPGDAANSMLLDELGKILGRKEKQIFGSSDLAANAPSTVKQKGRNEPLVDDGYLKNAVSYKTSKTKQVKGVD